MKKTIQFQGDVFAALLKASKATDKSFATLVNDICRKTMLCSGFLVEGAVEFIENAAKGHTYTAKPEMSIQEAFLSVFRAPANGEKSELFKSGDVVAAIKARYPNLHITPQMLGLCIGALGFKRKSIRISRHEKSAFYQLVRVVVEFDDIYEGVSAAFDE